MNSVKILVNKLALGILVLLVAACSGSSDTESLKHTLLCEGNQGLAPFEVRCEFFYLDENNYEVGAEDSVVWTLDIALEGIPQRFYSQTTGNLFITEIDRPGDYTLTAASAGKKSSIVLTITDADDARTVRMRQIPVRITSGNLEKQERILEASPGYEIIDADIEIHPNSSRVSSRIMLSPDGSSARLLVNLQPKLEAFKNVVMAWFAGNVILTERKI